MVAPSHVPNPILSIRGDSFLPLPQSFGPPDGMVEGVQHQSSDRNLSSMDSPYRLDPNPILQGGSLSLSTPNSTSPPRPDIRIGYADPCDTRISDRLPRDLS